MTLGVRGSIVLCVQSVNQPHEFENVMFYFIVIIYFLWVSEWETEETDVEKKCQWTLTGTTPSQS